MLKVKYDDWYGGYNIVRLIPMGRGKKRRESVIATGFRDYNKAIDYARLLTYDTLRKKYDFTKKQKEVMGKLYDAVHEACCDWTGFVENVIHSDYGLSGLLYRIDSNMSVQDIVYCYI